MRPTATTVAFGDTPAPSKRGSTAVVQQQIRSASAIGASWLEASAEPSSPAARQRFTNSASRPGSRATTSTRSIGRIARIASTCAHAWGPVPKTSICLASGSAMWRTASADTAEVRSVVSALPSISALGSSVPGSKST